MGKGGIKNTVLHSCELQNDKSEDGCSKTKKYILPSHIHFCT